MSDTGGKTSTPATRVLRDRFEECAYRPGFVGRFPVREPLTPLGPEELDVLLEQGDQRVGATVFRTECPSCRACEPLRVDIAAFRPSRSQRRVWRRNEGEVSVEVGDPVMTRRRVALWTRHRRARGLMRDGARKDPEGYSEWLVETCAPTVEVRYLLDSRLIAVSLLDLGRTSANSAYHYFDPQHAERSLGVYSVLKEIELCRALGMRWYYLGLWIAQSAPVRYKTEYLPHERLVRGVWRRFEEPVPKLELDPPARPPTARAGARTRAMRDGA